MKKIGLLLLLLFSLFVISSCDDTSDTPTAVVTYVDLTNNNEVLKTENVAIGSTATNWTPEKEGYIFDKWYATPSMNIEYDFIREIFMQKGNEQRWERFKYYYNYKRYFSYLFTLERISREFKREYVRRISREFRRALTQEELSLKVFTPNTRKKIELLMHNPEVYYWKYVIFAGSPVGRLVRKIRNK